MTPAEKIDMRNAIEHYVKSPHPNSEKELLGIIARLLIDVVDNSSKPTTLALRK